MCVCVCMRVTLLELCWMYCDDRGNQVVYNVSDPEDDWNHAFALTMTYRVDSDVFSPYAFLLFEPKPLKKRPNYCKFPHIISLFLPFCLRTMNIKIHLQILFAGRKVCLWFIFCQCPFKDFTPFHSNSAVSILVAFLAST